MVRLSDKIAYINHDIDDAIRAKIFTEDQLPSRYTDVLGHSVRERLNLLVHDIILQSMDAPEIKMSPAIEEAMQGLVDGCLKMCTKTRFQKQRREEPSSCWYFVPVLSGAHI